MWLDRVLARGLAHRPDSIAIRDSRRALTWRRLTQEVEALATRLAAEADRSERVLVVSYNRVEMLEAYLGCARAGVIAVPVNPGLADAELDYIMEYVGPRLVLTDAASRERFTGAGLPVWPLEGIEELAQAGQHPGQDPDQDPVGWSRREPALDEPFAILHTSATTGHPKGAITTHRSLQANAMSWFGDVRPTPDTVYLNASPLFHGSMLIALDYLAAGATVCVLERFTPHACLAAIDRWRVEHALLVPSMIRLLLQARALENADLGSLNLVLHTAEPMPATLTKQAAAAFQAELLNVYGLTEAGGPVITCRSDEPVGDPVQAGATCAGVPMLGVDARVAVAGRDGPAIGEVGEILIRGDGIMPGYWRRPEATAEAVRDGWLHTGDLGYLAADGRIWVVGRRTDLILRGGQNVYPAEIERVLRKSSQVADVAVVAAPSETWGQTPWAFVQPTSPEVYDERELLDLCVKELASFKRPSRFLQVATIPRNPAGKLLRRILRDQAVDMAGGDST